MTVACIRDAALSPSLGTALKMPDPPLCHLGGASELLPGIGGLDSLVTLLALFLLGHVLVQDGWPMLVLGSRRSCEREEWWSRRESCTRAARYAGTRRGGGTAHCLNGQLGMGLGMC